MTPERASTEMLVSVVPASASQNSIKKTVVELHDVFSKLLARQLVQAEQGEIFKWSPLDVRHVLGHFKSGSRSELAIRNILLEACISTERATAGSSLPAAITCLDILRLSNGIIDAPLINQLSNICNDDLRRLARWTTSRVADQCIVDIWDDSLMSSLIIEACRLAGPGGHISIDPHPTFRSIHLEHTMGYRFSIKLLPEFASMIKRGIISYNDPAVVVIDGIIESVGEINQILEYFADTKEPCYIIARGFAGEVLSTLAANYLRGTLRVIPVPIPTTPETANILVDIAIVCGTDVVSSLKGELISNIDPESIPRVDVVKISQAGLIIDCKETTASVNRHAKNIRRLIKRKEKYKVYKEMIELFEKRLASLIPSCVHIRLDSRWNKNTGIIKDRMGCSIGLYTNISRFGIIDLDIAHELIRNRYYRSIVHKLQQVSPVWSSAAIIEGIKIGIKAAEEISSIGTMIVDDKAL